jgi:hypothetical protein
VFAFVVGWTVPWLGAQVSSAIIYARRCLTSSLLPCLAMVDYGPMLARLKSESVLLRLLSLLRSVDNMLGVLSLSGLKLPGNCGSVSRSSPIAKNSL